MRNEPISQGEPATRVVVETKPFAGATVGPHEGSAEIAKRTQFE